MPPKAKRLKRPQVSFQGKSMPLEPSLQPSESVQLGSTSLFDDMQTNGFHEHSVQPSESVPLGSTSLFNDLQTNGSSPLGSASETIVPPTAPTSQPHPGRESSRVWTVQAIDSQGNTKTIRLSKPEVFEMPRGQRIIVSFDKQGRAFGEAAALLGGACGRVVRNSRNMPINFESWPKVPKSYKEDCFNIVKNLFHFQASNSISRRYCFLTMSRKYRNGKLDLWNSAFDPSLSREQLIAKVPQGIHKDQWSSFVDYHLRPEYQELCRKNAEARKKQTIPHTGGSKLLSRKHHEMEVEVGRAVGRAELYIATHKKKDGSYVSEEAQFLGEKMIEEMSQSANSSEISSNDAIAKVLGKDYPGRVRCLGLGGLHSIAFSSTTRFSGMGCNFSSFDSAETSQLKEEVVSLKSKLATSQEDVKTLKSVMLAYIQMKEGHIPAELGALFNTDPTNIVDEGSEQDMSAPRGRSSLASNPH